ncbi:MAG: class I SAM-dependent methyltransferase [Ferruginibacter sp.]
MNTVIKHIVANTYKPLLARYLAKTRVYRYENLQLKIAPEVFHPGFFFSTRLLLQYISKLPLQKKEFMELGCGSGLISIVAAKKSACVTATDINPIALEFLKMNCFRNNVQLKIFHSDLFNEIPVKQYDIIAINPPYYKKDPVTMRDHAWFCGGNGEYFERLFKTMHKYIHVDTEILMVLFDGCDMEMINDFATRNNFILNCVVSKQNMLEKNFIYKIEKYND